MHSTMLRYECALASACNPPASVSQARHAPGFFKSLSHLSPHPLSLIPFSKVRKTPILSVASADACRDPFWNHPHSA